MYQLSEENKRWAEEAYGKLQAKMTAQCKRVGDIIPYSPTDGKYTDLSTGEKVYWWTNGFWAGILWQMYHATKDGCFKEAAEGVERRLDEALHGYIGLHHDVGFMWLHSSVANYRLTGSEASRTRGLHAANLLAGRFNPAGKFIRAWNGDRTGWMIVDCMMNVPILYWAGEELNDPRFAQIAQMHADTCQAVTVRPDGSCNHIVVMDPNTGELLETPGGQGIASGSSWSRGQAWGLYGFTLSYLHSKKPEYLETAKRIAHYFIANLSISGWLPLVDFRSPAQPVKYDSTAAMIACCGLLEIAKHVGEYEKPLYTDAALNILRACDEKFANWDPEEDALMGWGTEAYNSKPEGTHIPIIYGDYFFTEAILRLNNKDFLIW
jgi:unsaturated chondroitin disaccharide hydrolase